MKKLHQSYYPDFVHSHIDVERVKRFLLDFHARSLPDLKARTTVLVDSRKIDSMIRAEG